MYTTPKAIIHTYYFIIFIYVKTSYGTNLIWISSYFTYSVQKTSIHIENI